MPRIKKACFNEFHVDDKIFRDVDVVMHNNGAEEAERTHRFTLDHFERLMLREPECIVIGTGFKSKVSVAHNVLGAAKKNNVELHALPTPEAVERFKELSRSRRVSAFFHISD